MGEKKFLDRPSARALMRGVRITIALIISGILTQITGDERWVALAPILEAILKYIRDVWKIDLKVV